MSYDSPDPEVPHDEPVAGEVVAGDQSVAPPGLSSADESTKLSFLHPTSLVFELVSQIKSYIVPAALGLFGAAKGEVVFIILSAVIFIPAFLTCVFRYFTFRYCIKDDHLIVTQGVIFKSVRTIPVNRIQNIDFVQNLLHRAFKVAEVKIETASGTKPEATMRVLSMAQMAALRRSVFDKKATVAKAGVEQVPASDWVDNVGSELGYAGTGAQLQPAAWDVANQSQSESQSENAKTKTLRRCYRFRFPGWFELGWRVTAG